jgi:hypothetical protein
MSPILPKKQEMTTNIDIVIYTRKSADESDTKHMDSANTLEFGHTISTRVIAS